MGRGLKIAIAVLVALALLVGLNAVVTGKETKSADVTFPGGRIVSLPGGDLQVIDRGPRDAPPIVLVHCFTCSMEWWKGMIPRLQREHRVVAVDLLGHGGSEKPGSGYSMENQADLIAQVLGRLGVRDAEVVGHSLGGPISIALAEQSPQLVDRLVIIDSIPDTSYGDVGFIGELPFKPVMGETLWRVKPDFAIGDGLEVAFAPGFPVPDGFVENVKQMTYSSYSGSHDGFDEYTGETPLPERAGATGKPVLAIMGAEEQIADDPRAALAAYRAAGAKTELISGAGHSPNVEMPALTAGLVLSFAATKKPANRVKNRNGMQRRLQDRDTVRGPS
ncbi:MAG TPA: alpha/beta hydrolase [Solirubrobacterales bacterium]|nr:alpha/beta hydrolase [Solirubrobacterales bacterium]